MVPAGILGTVLGTRVLIISELLVATGETVPFDESIKGLNAAVGIVAPSKERPSLDSLEESEGDAVVTS
jgi:hypothetical protein